MKKKSNVGLWILACVIILVLAKNVVLKAAIEIGTKAVTGLTLQIKTFEVSLTQSYLKIEGLELLNPADFEEPRMVVLPRVFVRYDLPAIFKGVLHVRDFELHLAAFNVVKNKNGVVNLDSLKAVQASKKEPGTAAQEKSETKAEKKKPFELKADHLKLQIDRVTYQDYTREEPAIQNYDINLKEEYSNIRSLNAVVSLIVVKAMMHTSIAALGNIDLGGLQDTVSGLAESSAKFATDAAAKAGDLLNGGVKQIRELDADKLKNAAGSVTDAAKGVTGSLANATSSLKGKLSGFGIGSKEEAAQS